MEKQMIISLEEYQQMEIEIRELKKITYDIEKVLGSINKDDYIILRSGSNNRYNLSYYPVSKPAEEVKVLWEKQIENAKIHLIDNMIENKERIRETVRERFKKMTVWQFLKWKKENS